MSFIHNEFLRMRVGRATSMGISAKKVLITSNGDAISCCIAYYLANNGCRVVMMGDEALLQCQAATATLNYYNAIKVIQLDMEETDQEVFDDAVGRASKLLGGKIDAFVNCYLHEGKMQELLQATESDLRKMLAINFSAAWFLLKAVGKRMKTGNVGGSIIFLTSIIGAERGLYPGSAVFGSCLAGVHQLVRLAALELGKYKIRVNAVSRGLHSDDEYILKEGKDKAEKLVTTLMPLGRWLDPERDLPSTVLYLVSDDSRYMTGTTVFVDGGQSIVRPRLRSSI